MGIELNVLHGIQNFLQYVNNNWTAIVVVIGLIIAIAKKVIGFLNRSDEEKIYIAKKQIQETMLKLVTDAEIDYLEWVSAGAVKRSQVIEKIFTMYPILSKVIDHDSLFEWIDELIDNALDIMREVFEKQKQTDKE